MGSSLILWNNQGPNTGGFWQISRTILAEQGPVQATLSTPKVVRGLCQTNLLCFFYIQVSFRGSCQGMGGMLPVRPKSSGNKEYPENIAHPSHLLPHVTMGRTTKSVFLYYPFEKVIYFV